MTAFTPKSPSSRACMKGASSLSFGICCSTYAKYIWDRLRDSLTQKKNTSRQHDLPFRFAPPKTSTRSLIRRKDPPTGAPTWERVTSSPSSLLPRAFEKKKGGYP